MNWNQWAILQCNLFVCTAIITDKTLPLVLSIMWLAINFYFQYLDKKHSEKE